MKNKSKRNNHRKEQIIHVKVDLNGRMNMIVVEPRLDEQMKDATIRLQEQTSELKKDLQTQFYLKNTPITSIANRSFLDLLKTFVRVFTLTSKLSGYRAAINTIMKY